MKHRLLLLCLLVCSIGIYAAEVNGVRIATSEKDASGKEITYDFLFTSKPKLTYLNSYDGTTLLSAEVAISSTDVKGRFGKDEIILDQSKLKSMTFIDVSATKIDALMAEGNLCVQLTDEGLQLNGLQASEAVKIYSLDGKLLYAATASANGNVLLRMPSHKSGTAYIVKVGKASFKVRTNN